MIVKKLLCGFALSALSAVAMADLEPYSDYDISDAIWSVTTVKVDANMGDAYLEGLEKTWAASNKVAQDLCQIEEWRIFRSMTPNSGDFNLLLVVKFADTDDLAPNKAEYDKFMAEWGEQRNQQSTEIAQKEYPKMREITGDYLLREITLK